MSGPVPTDDCMFQLVEDEWVKFDGCDDPTEKCITTGQAHPKANTEVGGVQLGKHSLGRITRYPCGATKPNLLAQLKADMVPKNRDEHMAILHGTGGIVRRYLRVPREHAERDQAAKLRTTPPPEGLNSDEREALDSIAGQINPGDLVLVLRDALVPGLTDADRLKHTVPATIQAEE